jgi:putative hydrolase of the HAD superfamily
VKALLFDFFGTLVEYQPDRSSLGSPRSHELARSFGFTGDHKAFVRTWDEASLALERTARLTLRDFSMNDAAAAFAAAASLSLSDHQVAALGTSFVTEWAGHIQPVPGAGDLIHRLAERWSIAVVSNTHDLDMVPNMLDDMAILADLSAVTLSIGHGWMKPHPSIYTTALHALDCSAPEAVFIGDNYEADYVGPLRAGMRALLVDPEAEHPIPANHRLSSVLDVAEALEVDAH